MAEAKVEQQRRAPPAGPSAEINAEAPLTSAQEVIKPLDEATNDFDFWEDLKDSMPPWIDEIVGFALIVFGVLSFISLYISSDALVAVTWADMLTALFGSGSILVAGSLFALGVVLWLPKAGLRFRISAARLLALELMFLSILALLHLGNSEGELRALARSGQGGGLIGWGLSYPFFWIMGRPAALAFFVILIGICAVAFIGLRPRHVSVILTRLSRALRQFSESRRTAPENETSDESRSLYRRLAGTPGFRVQIMRIRPNPENMPGDLRANRQAKKLNDADIARVRSPQSASPGPNEPPASASNGGAENGAYSKGPNSDVDLAPEASSPPQDGFEQATAPSDAPAGGARDWTASLPDMDCLTAADLTLPQEDEINRNAMLIQNTLLEFDLETTVVDVQVGPTVTRYALQPHKEDGSDRIRMSRIASYARDLSLALAAKRLRMETPVPGTTYMGIEVPNKEPGLVALRNVMESEQYINQQAERRSPLLIPLGRNVTGEPVSLDLTQMPHLLIAGATGSGKSVCMAAIATSLLMQFAPSELQLIMLDPKMVELSRFDCIPHLVGPVEIHPDRIIGVLRWCTAEMDRRYKLLEEAGARNIKMYNEAELAKGDAGRTLPYLVIMIDEIGDLMLSSPDEVERALTRLAQMARAVGMHMVIATQRPSVDVITGLIKANFPSRIAFSVASGADSRVIIDRSGAEHLLGGGDMLFLSSDAAEPRRIQGCFVSEDDVRMVVDHWRAKADESAVTGGKGAAWDTSLKRRQFIVDTDPMLEDVLKLVVDSGEASASLIQRRLGLGYPRAARIMDLLAELGVVGEEIGGGRSRKITIPPGIDPLNYVFERYTKAQQ